MTSLTHINSISTRRRKKSRSPTKDDGESSISSISPTRTDYNSNPRSNSRSNSSSKSSSNSNSTTEIHVHQYGNFRKDRRFIKAKTTINTTITRCRNYVYDILIDIIASRSRIGIIFKLVIFLLSYIAITWFNLQYMNIDKGLSSRPILNNEDSSIPNVHVNSNNVYHSQQFKRIVFYSQTEVEIENPTKNSQKYPYEYMMIDPMLHVSPGEESVSQPVLRERNDNCVPMQPWQLESYPTCNIIHELDLDLSGMNTNMNEKVKNGMKVFSTFLNKSKIKNGSSPHIQNVNYTDDHFHLLGNGWFRHTWKVGSIEETVVLKTLRFERDYLSEYFELHRRESTAMERLTSSPYVIDIYSFCGQSTVNEYASFIDGFQHFKHFAKQLRGKNNKNVLYLKLQIAIMIAQGVQQIHEIDGPDNATMVHYDINPMNVVLVDGGIPKINDFNVVEFMYWDQEKNERCGFKGRFREPWWRSPEEMLWVEKSNVTEKNLPLLDETVDIFSLGNIIYNLLTGYTPRGATNKKKVKQVRDQVQKGIPPLFDRFGPEFYSISKEPTIVALREAVKKCYQPDPQKRSSAREIATYLMSAMNEK